MTSKLTRLTDDELTETLRQATSGYPLPACVEGNLRQAFAELHERRKADSEPVAWAWHHSKQWHITNDEERVRDLVWDGVKVEPLYRHAQPAPVVLADGKLRELFDAWFASDCSFDLSPEASEADNIAWRESYWYVWKRCRAAMLQAGNSPVIPEGYVMVPKDLLSELRDWAHPEIEKYCEMWEGRRDSEFPALRKVIADADALLAASPQEVKDGK